MTRIYGKDHENTLKALNHQARVTGRNLDHEEAAGLHLKAWEGLKKRLGELHLDTLEVLEDLVTCRIRVDAKYLPGCHEQMMLVVDQRRKVMGKEHPYTLLAICSLCRVKSAMGQHQEAAEIMKPAYDIAVRNMGKTHIGVLAGATHFAQVLVQLGRYEEAEALFTEHMKDNYRHMTEEDGEHPDRCAALWYLIGCLEKQGKFEEALDTAEILINALQNIGGRGLGMRQKMAKMVQDEIARLKRKIEDNVGETDPQKFILLM